jgi:SAM-dependent methyltransferase
MLAGRFANDGRAAIALTEVQAAARDEVRAKLLDGTYVRVAVGCPFCRADEPVDIAAKDMYGLPHPVAACRRCGFVYTRLRLTDASLQSFYDGEYRRLDRGVPLAADAFFDLERTKGPMIDARLRAAGVALEPGSLILEVGCGAGGTLAWFQDRGHRVLGVDLGSEYLAYGRERAALPLYQGDAQRGLDLAADAGDAPALVIYEQVLEHVPDPVSELERLRERVTQGTHVFLGVPGLRNIHAHYGSDVLRYLQLPHLSHFDLASLTAVAARAGFSRLVGDETVHGVFAADAIRDDLAPQPYERTLRELHALERRLRGRSARRRVAGSVDVAVGTMGRLLRNARLLGR